MRLEAVEQFASLPNFAQALVALRMVHRAALAKYPANDSEKELIESALAAAGQCVRDGQGNFRHKALFHRAMALRDLFDERRKDRERVRSGLWWAIDATNAAEMANEFPVDATVTRSARSAIAVLGEDRELSRMQITILLASDIDQILFACGEVDKLPSKRLASKYEGVGDHVLGRLAPVHPLTVTPYIPGGEEAAR
jgi:hypothetical protein